MITCWLQNVFIKEIYMKVHLKIALVVIFFCYLNASKTRRKRWIVFTNGGTLKLVMGFAIPVSLGTKQSMGMGLNFQFQFTEPADLNDVLPPYPPIVVREKRENPKINMSDRILTYLAIESLLDKHGVKGRECLLRSICENAMYPLNHNANGLYGELLHIIFTPDYGGEDPDLEMYIEAQRAGEYGVDCLSLYNQCKYGDGIMDLISLLDI